MSRFETRLRARVCFAAVGALALLATLLPGTALAANQATHSYVVVLEGGYALDGSYALGQGYALVGQNSDYALDGTYALGKDYALYALNRTYALLDREQSAHIRDW